MKTNLISSLIQTCLLMAALPAVAQAQFNYITNNGTIAITGYSGSGGAVTIPSTINGLPVTSIFDYAFGDASLANVTTFAVEACTNLHNPFWFPVATNILAGDSSYFSDPQSSNYPARFYRLRSP